MGVVSRWDPMGRREGPCSWVLPFLDRLRGPVRLSANFSFCDCLQGDPSGNRWQSTWRCKPRRQGWSLEIETRGHCRRKAQHLMIKRSRYWPSWALGRISTNTEEGLSQGKLVADGEESRMNIDAESLPSCYAIAWDNHPDAMVALSPSTLEMSPQTLKDYPDLTFMK